MEPVVVAITSKEEYEQLMTWAQEQGYTWSANQLATQVDVYTGRKRKDGDAYGISFDNRKRLGHCSIEWYEQNLEYGRITSLEDFFEQQGVSSYSLPDDYF
jgi:hypothetical protein